MKIALLADLFDPIEPDAQSDRAILTFELADGLREYLRDVGGLTVDLVAKRDSWRGLPLISVDVNELPATADQSLDLYSRQEAAYCQLILSGLLRDYDLIHCLAPILTPLQLIAAMNIPILQTHTVSAEHPSSKLPAVLVKNLRRVAVTSYNALRHNAELVRPAVNLTRFLPSESNDGQYLLWVGTDGRDDMELAKGIAAKLNLPLLGMSQGDPVRLLQSSIALLDLSEKPSPAGPQWALRALACGKPVAGWEGGGLDEIVERPGVGVLAKLGDADVLVDQIAKLEHDATMVGLRRQAVLALNGRRAIVARYVEIYRSILKLS